MKYDNALRKLLLTYIFRPDWAILNIHEPFYSGTIKGHFFPFNPILWAATKIERYYSRNESILIHFGLLRRYYYYCGSGKIVYEHLLETFNTLWEMEKPPFSSSTSKI